VRPAGEVREARPVGSSRTKRQYRADAASRTGWGKEAVLSEQYRYFVGIDWATESHEVCVLNTEQRVVDRKAVEHSGSGIAQFVEYLEKLSEGDPEQVAIGIEIPRGALVETLVERRFAVYSLNPKQMDRFRDRHSVAGAKDDRRDAFVIADSLRTDRKLFHRVRIDEPLVIRIRELSRTEEDVQQEQVRMGHQLRDLLRRYFPQMVDLCPGVDEPWFWELIELAPLPAKAAKLTRARIEKILRSHRIRRLTAEQIVAQLTVPPLRLAPGAVEAAAEHVLLLIPRLRMLHQQRKDIAGRIEAVLGELSAEGEPGEHRDVTLLLSLPGAGRVVAATMLAEASQPLGDRDYHALRSYSGVAPITRRSGKRCVVVMRQSCNERLRNAVYHWSRVSAQCDERSREHYAELRRKGHTHGRALRGVADRLLAVLVAMLKSGTRYDPEFRNTSFQGNEQPIAAI
jgi:transposase